MNQEISPSAGTPLDREAASSSGVARAQDGAGDSAAEPSVSPAQNGRRKRNSLVLFVAVLVIGAAIGAWYVVAHRGIEDTDDAFIGGSVYSIAPKIAGRLKDVPVHDNQSVQAGELLAEIDPADAQSRVDRARAVLDLARAEQRGATIQVGLVDAATAAAVVQARAEVAAAEARLEQVKAEVDSATNDAQLAQADLARYSNLSENAVSRQKLDLVKAATNATSSSLRAVQKRAVSAEADVAAANSRAAAAEADRHRVDTARADVEQHDAAVQRAEAELHAAELDLSYTRIEAPAAGRVTSKNVTLGDYVQAGRNLMALVSPDVWVVANFKETQLERVKPGQRVTVHVDAYDVDLAAHVDSIQAGSGAHFSLLPPQNATGNYVKVVQRVPVKIVFDDPAQVARYLLGPGMSVVPRVDTR